MMTYSSPILCLPHLPLLASSVLQRDLLTVYLIHSSILMYANKPFFIHIVISYY